LDREQNNNEKTDKEIAELKAKIQQLEGLGKKKDKN
jgi:hypothetical protein